MERKNFRTVAVLPAALLLALAACEAKKSSNPLSPSVAGPIPGVEITAPVLVEPAQGIKYKESQQPIKLVIQNATTSGVRPVTYTFEVATDANFGTKVFARASVPPGDGGRTTVQADRLDLGRAYYWRARAEDGANSSLYSSAQFEVLPKPDLSVPALLSPINNERATSAAPTLTVGNSSRNAAVGDVRYQFQVAQDAGFSSVSASGEASEGGGETSYQVDSTLTANLTYFWRARATDGETTTSWSGAQTFLTPTAAPTPGPSPAPGPTTPPGNGGSCASNDGKAIVSCVAAAYPDRTAARVSLGQRIANMEFLRDRIIEAGICGGLDLAWNLKRGKGPHSIDALAWRHNGVDDVVDVGTAYDDTSRPLRLSWGIVAGPPGYDPYPRPSCK